MTFLCLHTHTHAMIYSPNKEVKMNKPGPNAAMTNVGQVILTLSKKTYQRFGNPHFYATVVTVPNVQGILSSAVGE